MSCGGSPRGHWGSQWRPPVPARAHARTHTHSVDVFAVALRNVEQSVLNA